MRQGGEMAIKIDLESMRRKRGLNQRELAERSGVPQPMISMIERGDTPNPGIITLHKLATALKCTVDDLVTDNNMPA